MTDQDNKRIDYPIAPPSTHTDILHGEAIGDPYRWLEESASTETTNWISAQAHLASAILDKIPGRAHIHQRLTTLWNYARSGIPFRRGGRYFVERNDGLQDQNVLCWMNTLDDEPQVLLDPNQLATDGTVALSSYAVSNDGRYLAYGLSASGSDWQEYRVREIETGQDRDDLVRWVKFSGAAWRQDNKGFYYSRYDAPQAGTEYKGANFYHKLYYHRLGDRQADDQLVYERPDHKDWNFGGWVTEDGAYLLIYVGKGTLRENALFYMVLDGEAGSRGENGVIELLPDFDASYSVIGSDGSTLYIMTNHNAPLYKVIALDLDNPAPDNWHTIIAESTDVLQGVSFINDTLIALYLHNAHSQVQLFDKNGTPTRTINLPGIGSVSGFGGRQRHTETFYSFASFTTPGNIYRYDTVTGASTLLFEPEIDFRSTDYETEQVFYESKDGTKIPMFLTYKKGLKRDGTNPTYLYGYGGFNIPLTPSFSESNLVWLEMGGIFAQANLRGGGEFGQAWYDAGKLHNKQNVFDDFIAAAEWLIANDYTSTPRLAIGGGSNGGLLVGACLTQRPDLFGACMAAVGVLDMLRFHKFTIGWAWVSDYGSPDDPDDFKTLLAYSPYHNIKPGTAYPPTLITTGDHDDRVFPGHSFKFAAALQSGQGGDAPVLIRIDTKAGHGAGKPTSKKIDEAADRWAFLIEALDME